MIPRQCDFLKPKGCLTGANPNCSYIQNFRTLTTIPSSVRRPMTTNTKGGMAAAPETANLKPKPTWLPRTKVTGRTEPGSDSAH